MATGAPSLREAHKSRTRAALREAALRLFATQGYDTTTAEEIAERARVSVRTFFRYYPTKESVLFLGESAWVDSFAEAYLGQPSSKSDADALCDTLVEFAPTMNRRRLRLFQRAVASSSTLRGREYDHQREDAEKMAAAIAKRRGLRRADDASKLLAAVALLTYLRALDAWLDGPARGEISTYVTKGFRLLAEPFAQTRAEPRSQPERRRRA